MLLLSRLRRMHGGKIPEDVLAKLRDQAQFEEWQDLDFWRLPYSTSRCAYFLLPVDILLTYGRCVFLADDKTCNAYDVRPSTCRLLRVSSDAQLCSKEAFEEAKGAVFRLV